MNKHTAGKWTNRTAGDPTDENGGQIYAGELRIATCHYGNGIDCDEKAANARLIAAAPELYHVTGMLADVSDVQLDALTHAQLINLITDLRNEARAAVKKAEGRI